MEILSLAVTWLRPLVPCLSPARIEVNHGPVQMYLTVYLGQFFTPSTPIFPYQYRSNSPCPFICHKCYTRQNLINPPMTLVFKFRSGFKFTVPFNAFTTVRCTEFGEMRRNNGPYIAPRLELKVKITKVFLLHRDNAPLNLQAPHLKRQQFSDVGLTFWRRNYYFFNFSTLCI